jgi:hypothetical protein
MSSGADVDFEFEEESELTVRARRHERSRPTVWSVGKRGTVFGSEPPAKDVDWFKDLTHVYRDKTTGKKRGRREWATILWVRGRDVQRLLTSGEEAALTKIYFAKCGSDSIQWGNVERRGNRVFNPGTGQEYPLVSEDLWAKHVGSKRPECRQTLTTK